MAIPIIAGPIMGACAGAAMYYTISRSINDDTTRLRSELSRLSRTVGESSLETNYAVLPPAPTLPELPPAAPLAELVKQKWNIQLSRAVSSVTTIGAVDLVNGAESAVSGLRKTVQSLTDRLGVSQAPDPTILAGPSQGVPSLREDGDRQ